MVTARLTTLIIVLAVTFRLSASDKVETRIFHPDFHTLRVHPADNDMVSPVIRLGSDDRLAVSFDELATAHRHLRYELIHCDAGWRPDNLTAMEYIDGGFNEAIIDDFAYSRATTVHYVNYRVELPGDGMKPIVSGNYLMRVYDESDPAQTLLTVRFMVVEPLAATNVRVTSRTDIDREKSHQQLEISVDTSNAGISSPVSDLIVVVTQNSRTDNSVTLTSPSAISGKTASYTHIPQLIFPGGNEYRRFETVDTRFPGMGVESYMFADPFYHATLKTDTPRAGEPHSYDQTQHGRYRIASAATGSPDTEADYVMTHFTLAMPELASAAVHIDGDMTLRRLDPSSRMVYNHATGAYECAMLLKQGSYNYAYLALPEDSQTAYGSIIDGDSHATSNEYLVLVYSRTPVNRYHRLIGAATAVSGQ